MRSVGAEGSTTGQAPQKDQGAQSNDGQRRQGSAPAHPARPGPATGQGQRDQSRAAADQRSKPHAGAVAAAEQGQQGQSGQATGRRTGQAQQGARQQDADHRAAHDDPANGLVAATCPRATNVNFSVSVGTVVPTSVRVVAVPSTLVEIYPEWRGHMYFVVNDEIIIVDRSHRIIAVLPV